MEDKKDSTRSKLHDSNSILPDLMATQQKAMALELLHTFNMGILLFKSSTKLSKNGIYLRTDKLF